MGWREQTAMTEREEFVRLAQQGGIPFRDLCRRFGISAKTGYKWVGRADESTPAWSSDRSRRPHTSPGRTSPEIEDLVVAARQQYPTWGGRKIVRLLDREHVTPLPAPSTVTTILHRHNLIGPGSNLGQKAFQRFEHPHPNAMWQMDFMGHQPTATQRLHPLTLIDDHSRYALGVWACPHQQKTTVEAHLTSAFRRYGLPVAILTTTVHRGPQASGA
jgi:transposase-like protein